MKKLDKKKLEQLIENKLEEILKEDEADSIGGDIQSMGNLYGIPAYHGGKSPFGFIYQAFKDIVDTGVAGIETISAAGQALIKMTLTAVNAIINPFAEDPDYPAMIEKTDEELRKIDKRYADVFKRNIEALTTGDTFGFAFLYMPSTILALKLLEKTPAAAYDILNTLSGGLLNGYFKKNKRLFEAEEQLPSIEEIKQALQDPKIKATLDDAFKKVHQATTNGVEAYANSVVQGPISNLISSQAQKTPNLQQNDLEVAKQATTATAAKILSQKILSKFSK
jgi:hypothetical protein